MTVKAELEQQVRAAIARAAAETLRQAIASPHCLEPSFKERRRG